MLAICFFTANEMSAMLELSAKGVEEICTLKKAILTADQTGPADLASLVSSFGKS